MTHDNIDARIAGERAKALEKYKEIGLRLAGDPNRDILDYAINELVGLIRYGEMIRARAAEMPPEIPAHLYRLLDRLGSNISNLGYEFGEELIDARSQLLELNYPLGEPEKR